MRATRLPGGRNTQQPLSQLDLKEEEELAWVVFCFSASHFFIPPLQVGWRLTL